MAENELQQFSGGGELATTGQGTDITSVLAARAAQEVQGALVVAQKFPRDPFRAEQRIKDACQSKVLAEVGFYSYSKGGTRISGPSIHTAKMLARNWGNCKSGWSVVSQTDDVSLVETFCWDLETNYQQTLCFPVKHEIMLKGGQVKKLTDPREIYEHVANMAARRLRACIQGVIPQYIQEAAVTALQATANAAEGGVPLRDRIRNMANVFLQEFQVTQAMIEKRFTHNMASIDQTEFIQLKGIYSSLRDEASAPSDWFEMGDSTDTTDLPPGTTKTRKTRSDKGKKRNETPDTAEQEAPPQEEPVQPTPGPVGEDSEPPEADPVENPIEDQPNLLGEQPRLKEPATPTDIEKIKQVADIRLSDAECDMTGDNRNRVIGWACTGKNWDANNPTHGQAIEMYKAVKAMPLADIKEAVTAE